MFLHILRLLAREVETDVDSEIMMANHSEKNDDWVVSNSCSWDGRLVACGMRSGGDSLWHTDGQGLIWTSTDRCVGDANCIGISNDNSLVVTCCENREDILLLDGANGPVNRVLFIIWPLVYIACGVVSVIFSRDDNCLASGDLNGGILLWNYSSAIVKGH